MSFVRLSKRVSEGLVAGSFVPIRGGTQMNMVSRSLQLSSFFLLDTMMLQRAQTGSRIGDGGHRLCYDLH